MIAAKATATSQDAPARARVSAGEKLLLSLTEAAAMLSVSSRTLRRLIQALRIRPLRIGARTFVSRSELDQFVKSQAQSESVSVRRPPGPKNRRKAAREEMDAMR